MQEKKNKGKKRKEKRKIDMDYGGLGSGYSDRSNHNHRGPWTRCGFHQTVHGPRHQHHDQETNQETAGRVQFHGPSVQGGVDVHDIRLFGGEHRPVRG